MIHRLPLIIFLFTAFFIDFAQAKINIKEPMSPELFSRLPDVSGMAMSPDGSRIVYKARREHNGVPGVAIQVLDVEKKVVDVLIFSDDSKFVLGWIAWQGNKTVLFSTFSRTIAYGTPVTATRLLRVDIDTKEIKSAIPQGRITKAGFSPLIQDNVIDHMLANPDEFIVALRTSNAVASEVLRINHKTGRSKRLHRLRANTLDWMTDHDNNLRIAKYFKDTTIRFDHRAAGSKKWSPLFEYQTFDPERKSPLGFDSDPNILFYSALYQGRDAVFKTDLTKNPLQPELVYSDPLYDVRGRLITSPLSKRVVGIRHASGDGYVFWDPEYQALQKSLNKALPDTSNRIVGFSQNERRAIVLATSDIDAGTYYFWDRDNGTMAYFALKYAALEPSLMSEKQRISYQARDGLTISGYLTKPIHGSDGPGPTIIFPHGGPISYNGKGFDYWTQYFASQGYNVLQMNFRGSSGYGHDFMVSGLQDWGGKMQTDVEDGTRWLIEEGIADPNRICVVGASYGGYAALMEAANNSDLYQCAVSFAGVTDLQQLVSHSRKYTNHKVVKEQIGSNWKKLKKRSPVTRAADINVPTLLVQGTKDLRVPVVHGRRMNKRMKKAKKDVTYLELEGGNHYLSNEIHRVSFFQAMHGFLREHLD